TVSALESLKAAFPSFFLPFIFVYSPGVMLLGDSSVQNLSHIAAAVVFLFSFSILVNRYLAVKASALDMLLGFAACGLTAAYIIDPSHPEVLLFSGLGCGIACAASNILKKHKCGNHGR
ncbi:MAG: hypothetical protein J6I40_05490, partial [Mailhella sp.]|nr:hypothetical protein [Mailhella sp.]